MKKLFLILTLLFLGATAQAQMLQGIMGGGGTVSGGGGSSCTGATTQFSQTTDDAQREIGEFATTDYWSYQFTYAGTTGTLCQIKLKLKRYNDTTPTGSIYAYIYSNAAGSPDHANASISACGSKAMSDITTTGTEYTLSCADATITNSAKYWIVVYYDSANATNYPMFSRGYGLGIEDDSPDGTTWGNIGTSGPYLKVYIKE